MSNLLERLRRRLEIERFFQSDRSRRRFLLHVLVGAVVLTIAYLLARPYLSFLSDPQEVREFVRGFGILGPLAIVGLQAGQVVLAPVPGQVLALVAGYLFGPWWGTLYNMIGITIGSTIAFWLSRRYGRPYVENMVHEEVLERFDAISERNARSALFVIFLFPGLPDDIICFAGGLTSIPLWQLIVIAVLGRLPAFFLVNVVGSLLGTEEFASALVLGIALLAATVLGYLNRRRLLTVFGEDSRGESS